MDTIKLYFILFIIYSIVGWILECIDVLVESGTWMNRGFLIGPWLPIYGSGSLVFIIFLSKYLDDPLVFVILAMFVCSVLEYFTSWIMEKLFKARWWDYSDKKLNLNGRICVTNMVAFGVGGAILMYLVHPHVWKFLTSLSPLTINIIFITLLVIFLADLIVSLNVITKFSMVAKSIHKDSTEEITKRVRETLVKEGGLYKRLVSVFDWEASDSLLGSMKKIVKNQTLKAKKRIEIEKQRIKLLNKKFKLENRIKILNEEIKEVDKK